MTRIPLRILKAFLPLLTLVAAACNNTPFGGIAVPGMTSVEPLQERDESVVQEQLKALHVVNPTPYEIHPGDTFSLSVYNQPSLTTTLLIAPDGTSSLPLVGILKLGGLNLEDATELIQHRLTRYLRDPLVTLTPTSMSGFYFTIAGRVNKPGNFPVSIGQTKLLDAFALSGGLEVGLFHGDSVELADLDNAFIKRNGKKLPINFKKLIYEGDDLHNIPLLSGDYIYVPSTMSGSIIFLGEVGSNSYVGFHEGMTLTQGLAYVGGINSDTHSSYIKVIRGSTRDTVVYTVNIDDILNGRMRDFALEANDVIFVPQDDVTKWNSIVRKLLPTLQFVNMLAGPFGSTLVGYFNF